MGEKKENEKNIIKREMMEEDGRIEVMEVYGED